MKAKKIILKAWDFSPDGYKYIVWKHFCYIPYSLWTKYQSCLKLDMTNIDERIEYWAFIDFNFTSDIGYANNIYQLKGLIKKNYKEKLGGNVQVQGAVSAWMIKHMEAELSAIGK